MDKLDNDSKNYDSAALMNVTHILKTLSNPTRLSIVCALEEKDYSVNELVELLNLGQSALSQHLKILREAGLVSFLRDHNKLYYFLSDSKVTKLIKLLRQLYCS